MATGATTPAVTATHQTAQQILMTGIVPARHLTVSCQPLLGGIELELGDDRWHLRHGNPVCLVRSRFLGREYPAGSAGNELRSRKIWSGCARWVSGVPPARIIRGVYPVRWM